MESAALTAWQVYQPSSSIYAPLAEAGHVALEQRLHTPIDSDEKEALDVFAGQWRVRLTWL